MNISLNWLKYYVDIPVSVEELCDKMVMAGFEVESIVDQLTINDYNNFVDNLRKISSNDTVLPSTNFYKFIERIKK